MENIIYEKRRKFENRMPDTLLEECRDIVRRTYKIGEDIDNARFYDHVILIKYNQLNGVNSN